MKILSTRNLDALPPPDQMLRRCRALAAFDATLSTGPPIFSLDCSWMPGVTAAFFDDSNGSQLSIRFSEAGTLLRGMVVDAFMSPLGDPPFEPTCEHDLFTYPGLIKDLPPQLKSLLEDCDTFQHLTFCIWRTPDTPAWCMSEFTWPNDVDDPDGSEDLLALFDDEPDAFMERLRQLYQCKSVERAAVSRLLANEPITAELLAQLGSKRSLKEVGTRLRETGYPILFNDMANDGARAAQPHQRSKATASAGRPQQGSEPTGNEPQPAASKDVDSNEQDNNDDETGQPCGLVDGIIGALNKTKRQATSAAFSAVLNKLTGSPRPGSPNAEPVIAWVHGKRIELLLTQRNEMANRLNTCASSYIMNFHTDRESALAKFVEDLVDGFGARHDFLANSLSELADVYSDKNRADEARLLRESAKKFRGVPSAQVQSEPDLPRSGISIYIPLHCGFSEKELQKHIIKALNEKGVAFTRAGSESPEHLYDHPQTDFVRVFADGTDARAIQTVVQGVLKSYTLPLGSIVQCHGAATNRSVPLEEQLETLAACGITLNSGITIDDILRRETGPYANPVAKASRHDFEEHPFEWLLYRMGEDVSENIWHFDAECIEDHGSYTLVLEKMRNLAGGALPITDILDHLEIDDGEAWVEFKLSGEPYKWDAAVDNDWIDEKILVKMASLLATQTATKRYCFFSSGGQDGLIACLSPVQLNELTTRTGLQFKWLDEVLPR